jgi:uncharacterized YigZ family protein
MVRFDPNAASGGLVSSHITMRTISSDGEHELIVNKSRFRCALARVTSEPATREFIASRRKVHWNAAHHCTAYILGTAGETQRGNDDGEPAGTAGVPMLEVLRQRRLTNIVAVVTRYFGGVKLGAGGLIRAYGSAVSQAIDALGTVQLRPVLIVTVSTGHGHGARLEGLLRRQRHHIVDVRYGQGIELDVAVGHADLPGFTEWLAMRTAGAAAAAVTGQTVLEAP